MLLNFVDYCRSAKKRIHITLANNMLLFRLRINSNFTTKFT